MPPPVLLEALEKSEFLTQLSSIIPTLRTEPRSVHLHNWEKDWCSGDHSLTGAEVISFLVVVISPKSEKSQSV